MFGYTLKIKYENLAIFTYTFTHFWRLKTSKIISFSIFFQKKLVCLFGEISPVRKRLGSLIPTNLRIGPNWFAWCRKTLALNPENTFPCVQRDLLAQSLRDPIREWALVRPISTSNCPLNNSLFIIYLCILRDLPQQKNPRALCRGLSPNLIRSHVPMEIFLFYNVKRARK